eukprot:CAMPEP_0171487878 /NCGR_PEP_ID=MMETSP0958-20121227/1896_1 /TAXON_ID=87120 /ORGANISM="Aurantiochytrium limacinum, Strain ATCCMYA-1381" /LENGTH=407 /DNA_ID=CAMNT_0012020929 /DNA_START=34 /DNA_END=1257 /DNA_ORIENTATION=+
MPKRPIRGDNKSATSASHETEPKRRSASCSVSSVRVDAIAGEILQFVGSAKAWCVCRTLNRAWRDAADLVGLRNCWITPNSKLKVFMSKVVESDRATTVQHLDLTDAENKLTSDMFSQMLSKMRSLRSVRLEIIPGKQKGLQALFALPHLDSLEVLNMRGMTLPKKMALNMESKGFRHLHLWRAHHATDAHVRSLISPHMLDLSMSGAGHFSGIALRAMTELHPPLQRLVLLSCGSGHLDERVLSEALRALSPTLEHLNLSRSIHRFLFMDDWLAPRLRCLIIDEVEVERGFGRMILGDRMPRLESLSVARYAANSDDIFIDAESFQNRHGAETLVCPKLRVVQLTGTRITEKTIQFLERCPEFRLAIVDSCRGLSRAVRTKYAALRQSREMEKLQDEFTLAATVDL